MGGGTWTFSKAAILGATGPTGMELAGVLVKSGVQVRALSRSQANLDRCFPGGDVDRQTADAAAGVEELRVAIAGCDVVFDCVGLPGVLMDLHPVMARNLAAAVRQTGTRCVKVASFWSYLPAVNLPMNERHPREGGPPWTRLRRQAEDVLRNSGAAVVNLPDFYGPRVHASTLQQPLREAAAGKPMNWIGGTKVAHEYAFVPDAMETVARLATFDAAYGGNWIVPGSRSISGNRVAEIAGKMLGRAVRIRGAGRVLLSVVSRFNADLRGFMPMVPDYLKPITYDASKLRRLIGEIPVTSYEDGIRQTLTWMLEADRTN